MTHASSAQPPPSAVPTHVAIIMDGNGRWAKSRGLPRIEGHRRGVETVRTVIEAARDQGVRYVTLYAFSVENWKRPQDEVGALMHLLEYFLKRETKTLVKNGVRLRTIGRTDALPSVVREQLDAAKAATAHFTEQNLTLALNYGSRTELTDAVAAYTQAVLDGREPAPAAGTSPDWNTLARYLYTADLPDPDLIIRTSGENRVSNFLLLQAAYAEFYFTPVLWPDFDQTHFAAASPTTPNASAASASPASRCGLRPE